MMKFKKRVIALLIVVVMLLVFAVGSLVYFLNKEPKEDFKLTLTEQEERELLYINKEYDVSNLIQSEEGAEYSIKSLFYLDDDFKRCNIDFVGMKFTQNVPYDVVMVVEGKKEETVDDALIELPIRYGDELLEDEKHLVDITIGSAFSQKSNIKVGGIKVGTSSIKCSYSGNPYSSTFNVPNGGIVLCAPDNAYQGIYEYFSAYDAETRSLKSDTQKTYAGFWVKNTTGKKLTVCLNLRIYYYVDANGDLSDEGTVRKNYTYGAGALNYIPEICGTLANPDLPTTALTIEANDQDWHYYEIELGTLPDKIGQEESVVAGSVFLRSGIAAHIEGVAAGDTFYVDGFDVYHGSKVAQ